MHKGHINLTETLRITGLFGVLIVAGLLATGCGSTTTTTTVAKKPQIRIWRVGQSQDVLKSQINKFLSKNKSTGVTVTYTEKTLGSYELNALKSLAAQQGPDIWSIPNDWLGDHTPRISPLPDNYFFPLDSKGNKATTGALPAAQVKTLFPAGIAEQLIGSQPRTVNGQTTNVDIVYGLPTNVDTLRLYYNPAIFTTATEDFRKTLGPNPKNEDLTPVKQLLSKPPTTWLDLVAQEKYLTVKNGEQVSRSAIALGTADNVPNAQEILQLMIMQNGARIVSTDRKNALFHIPTTTPAGVSLRPGQLALDFFTSFSNPDKETYSWNPSMPQALDAFGQSKVAMVVAFSDFGDQLKIKYPKLQFSTAPVPQNSATEQPVNFLKFNIEAVTKTADTPSAAFAMLGAYTDSDSVNSIAQQKKLLSPYLTTLNTKASDPFVKQVLTGQAVFKRSRTQFDETFRQMIIDVTQNGLPPDQALDSAAQSINQLLQDDNTL